MNYENVKSVHIFGWAFKNKPDNLYLKKSLKNHDLWKQVQIDYRDIGSERAIEFYGIEKYLSRAGRDIFIKNDLENGRDCSIFERIIPNDLKYEISKGDHYILDIESVFLHYYQEVETGILFIKTVNRTYGNIEDIRKINDYGRRISLPFIPKEKDGNIICAEELGISSESKGISIKTNFRKNLCKYLAGDPSEMREYAFFLQNLLFGDLNDQSQEKRYGLVDAMNDDRMFTHTLIMNDELSNKIAGKQDWGDDFLDELLKIVYVDAESTSCPEPHMRDELLKSSLYKRWCTYGTMYAVTNHSMLCITGCDVDGLEAMIYNPFLELYIYITSLVVLQRVGIWKFSDEAGNVAHGVEKNGRLRKDKIKELLVLQEKYIAFKSKYLILQLSSQDQCVDIYKLFQKQLLIDEERAILDEQMESLYEAANVSNGLWFEQSGLKIAILAICIDIIANIVGIAVTYIVGK